jgi:glycosyltransferase involved in cell wall biosynthesis
VGSGDQLKFKEIMNSFGIRQSVIFLGHVKDEIFRKCYVACDVLVSPSLLEGFGLTILEAMTAGKPVIALNRGAASELVKDGVSGLIVNKPDPQEFANVMTFLVDNIEVIKSIGKRNKEYVAKNTAGRSPLSLPKTFTKFTWLRKNITKTLVQAYKNLFNITMNQNFC